VAVGAPGSEAEVGAAVVVVVAGTERCERDCCVYVACAVVIERGVSMRQRCERPWVIHALNLCMLDVVRAK
jgi:hypothetical protein